MKASRNSPGRKANPLVRGSTAASAIALGTFKWTWIAIVGLTAAVFFCFCFNAGAAELVSNGLLNQGLGTQPKDWQYEGWSGDPDATSFRWTKDPSGVGVLEVTNKKPNDSRWYQTFPVKPATWHRVSGWIRTDNVGTLATGAHLAELNSGYLSEEVHGTHDWQLIEFWMKTEANQTSAMLACRLGGNSSLNTGTVSCTALSFISTGGPPPDSSAVYGISFWDSPPWRAIVALFTMLVVVIVGFLFSRRFPPLVPPPA